MRIALLIMAGCTLAVAQTFSNISTSNDLDHETVRIVGNISVDSYVRINCGMTTGGPYTATSTTSYMTGLHGDSGEVVVDLGGLTPSTTYYCVPTARPNPNNSTGLVTGSEFSFTTLASPVHPVYPTAPAIYNPTASYPAFTTGYTIVRMIAGTGGSECQAASNVGPIPYGSGTWSVAARDTIQTVLNRVGYGAILEFDEGITCPVPDTNGYNSGYVLPVKAVDPNATGINDPAHRWIVIRTNQDTPAHFPPVGFRTGPTWDTYEATFQSQVPLTLCCANGQHFGADTSDSGTVHHYWMYDLHLTVNTSVSSGPWYEFIDLGSSGSSFSKTNPPQYFVIDRVHFDCPGLPIQCQGAIWGIPGGNVALTNNYIGILDNGSNGTLAQGIYWTDCTGGPLYHDNNFISAIGQGFYIESNSDTGCGQAPTSAVSPTDITFTHNALYWPLSTLHSSYANNPAWDGYSRSPNRNQIESKRARRVLIQGNLIDGQWSGQNEGSAMLVSGNSDSTLAGQTGNFDWNVTFNLVRHSANVFNCMGTRPLGNPGPPDNAGHRRQLFANNLAYDLGRYNYAADGSNGGLYSGYFINENGCQDTTVQQNTFGFSNADSGSTGIQFVPDILFVGGGGILSEGFFFRNNIAHFGVGNPTYNAGIVWDNEQNCCSASAYLANPLPVNTNQMTLWQSSMVQIGSSVVANGTWGHNIVIGSTISAGAKIDQ